MPVYDYKCENCGRFELKQRITEDAITSCPTCGGKVERLIGRNVGIVFKGSGFYVTDSKMTKDAARQINQERQKDNQALLDGDIKSYVEQSESTDKKLKEA